MDSQSGNPAAAAHPSKGSASTSRIPPIDHNPTVNVSIVPSLERTGIARLASGAFRVARLLAGLFLFVGALQLLKTAAAGLSVLESGILVENVGTALGLGWLGALLVLSGSPVAATALALVAGGEQSGSGFSELQGFAMLTGSRLGAAFVVLVTAVVWALREGRGGRAVPLSTAVLALTGTAIVYIPAALVGALLLTRTPIEHMDARLPTRFVDIIDVVYGDLVDHAKTWPAWVAFAVAIAVLLLAFKVIDTVLPRFDEESLGTKVMWLQRKWPMFALGSLVALVTMSVSVALTVLVPLVARGRVRRENILPYVFGANITTLGDTMFAAFALNSPGAVRIVLVEVMATTLISVVLLTFFYAQVRRALWSTQRWVVDSSLRLGLFTIALFLVPLLAIGVSAAVG
jgi:solute carrier family 34 (sodium-dependent phosphate cotransporter)